MVKQKKEVSAWLASQPSAAKLVIHYYDANKNLLLNGERLTKVMREGMERFLLLLQLENGWIPSDLRSAFHSVLEDAD